MEPLDLITDEHRADPLFDATLSSALLQQVGAGLRGDALRIFRPGPTFAFGRRDARSPGFAAAGAAARSYGFTPLIRAAGGHAAAYDERSLIVEHVVHVPGAMTSVQPRFVAHARRLHDALAGLGADVRIGELPGEYCPGAFSLHVGGPPGPRVGGRLKVAGVAQRVIKQAALTTAVVVVGNGAHVRAAITAAYAALAMPVDPRTAGSLDETLPGITIDDVDDAVRAAFATELELRPRPVDERLRNDALALAERHRP